MRCLQVASVAQVVENGVYGVPQAAKMVPPCTHGPRNLGSRRPKLHRSSTFNQRCIAAILASLTLCIGGRFVLFFIRPDLKTARRVRETSVPEFHAGIAAQGAFAFCDPTSAKQ